jgi:hypothetical protein
MTAAPATNRALRSVLRLITESEGKNPTALLIENIQATCRSALELLEGKTDPFAEKVGFIMLAIRQSTEVKVKIVNGKRLTRVTIKDSTIYEWAMEQAHAIHDEAP